MGSAILLFSCAEQKQAEPINEDTLISRTVDSMEIVSTKNGKKVNLFTAPIMEEYEFARVPFREYRQGIEVIAYNDSTGLETSHIVADYALNWIERDLWELKGNVVAVSEDGRKLFSQQLTWDKKTKKIYSNVDSKVEEGEDVFVGEGFEADEDFNRWTFRRLKGRVSVDVEPTQQEQAPANDSVPSPQPASPQVSVPAQVPEAQPVPEKKMQDPERRLQRDLQTTEPLQDRPAPRARPQRAIEP